MITLDAGKTALAAATHKKVYWKFDVTDTNPTTYRWGQRAFNDGANDYLSKIVKGSFDGIRMRASSTEMGLIAPTETSFKVANVSGALDPADFIDGVVTITLRLGSLATADDICAWKFKITQAEQFEGEMTLTCEDFFSSVLLADYPNDPLVDSMYPSTNRPKAGTREQGGYGDMTLPRGYGTFYAPCVPVYVLADDKTYYLVGQGSATAGFTVSAIHSPVENPVAEWTVAGGTTINKYVKASGGVDYVVAEPIIADSDEDGTADSVGVWQDGDWMRPAPLQIADAATSAIVSPEDVIEHFLKALGVAAGDIDTAGSFATAGGVYSGWSLAYAGAFWRKTKRQEALSSMLWPCNSYLLIGATIGLYIHSKTSVRTLDDGDIRRGTLRRNRIRKNAADSGQTSFVPTGDPMDRMKTITVTVKTTTASPSGSVLENRWVRDTQDVQRAATLALQRELLQSYNIDFETGYMQIALRPEDVITISATRFGAAFAAKITEMHITEADGIKFSAVQYSAALDDWGDLSPGAVTVSASAPVSWNGISYGPEAADPATGAASNSVVGKIILATNGQIYTKGKRTFASTTAGFFIGYDLTETDYVLNVGGANSYIKWDGGAMSVKMASGETFDLYGDLKIYDGGDLYLVPTSDDSARIILQKLAPGATDVAYLQYVAAGGAKVSFAPATDNTYDFHIGDEASYRWQDIFGYAYNSVIFGAGTYAGGATGIRGSVAMTSKTAGLFTLDADNVELIGFQVRFEHGVTNKFLFTGITGTYIDFATDNQIDIGDATHRPKDVYVAGNIQQGGAIAGALNRWVYQNDTLADDASVDLPDAVDGFGFFQCGIESALFTVAADGSCLITAGSTNAVATDTDVKACIFDNGTNGRFRNRLGSAQVVRIWFLYQ